MDKVLVNIFETLDQEGILYCLRRGSAELATPDRYQEIDLLVPPHHLHHLAKILYESGFATLPHWGHEPHHFFVTYNKENAAWLKLDVVTDLRHLMPARSLRIGLAEPCLYYRCPQEPAYVPSPDDEFIIVLLRYLINKGDFDSPEVVRLAELWREFNLHPPTGKRAAALVARYLAPAITWETLGRAIEAEDWQLLIKRRSAVIRQLFWRDPLMTIGRELYARALRRLRPFLVAASHRGMTVALLAPDGAGKTTLAKELAREPFIRARPIYLGLNSDIKNVRLPTTRWLKRLLESANGKRGPTPVLLKKLHAGSRLAEQWSRYAVAFYHRLRGRFVVFDRHPYEESLNGHALTLRRRLRRWLLASWCPTPDLVVVLDAPGEVLYQRKGEHNPEWLENQRLSLLGLRDQVPYTVVVDATQEVSQVRNEVIALIWDRYRARERKGTE